MRLRKFIQLTEQENKLQEQVLKAVTDSEIVSSSAERTKTLDHLHELITKADLNCLLKLVLNNLKMNTVCNRSCFESFWDEVWRLCGTNLEKEAKNNNEAIQEYLPISTVSSFELVKGFFVYQGYLKAVKNQEMNTALIQTADEYLSLASDFGCFFAINALCREGLRLLPSIKNDQEYVRTLAKKILHYANKAADLYWTPGYILLSNVWHGLARYALVLFPEGDAKISQKEFFMGALNGICVAHKMEVFSGPMIHDAYQGKTVFEASNKQLSSWTQAKLRLVALSRSLLQIHDLEVAEREALLTLNKLSKIHCLSQQKPSENKVLQPKLKTDRLICKAPN
jgi:hypothetical protein